LELFLPSDIDSASAELGSELLKAIARFPNLRKILTRRSLKYKEDELLQAFLPLYKLEEIAIGLPRGS
jgi:hypothetical protein